MVVQVLADGLHIGYLGSFSWPVFLAAGGAILIRRNASEGERVWINDDLVPMLRTGRRHHPGRWTLRGRGSSPACVLGIVGAASCSRGHTTSAALAAGRRGPAGHRGAIVVIFGPWWIAWSAT